MSSKFLLYVVMIRMAVYQIRELRAVTTLCAFAGTEPMQDSPLTVLSLSERFSTSHSHAMPHSCTLDTSLRLPAPGVWIAAARVRIAAVGVEMGFGAIGLVVKQRLGRTGCGATETDAGHIVAVLVVIGALQWLVGICVCSHRATPGVSIIQSTIQDGCNMRRYLV